MVNLIYQLLNVINHVINWNLFKLKQASLCHKNMLIDTFIYILLGNLHTHHVSSG